MLGAFVIFSIFILGGVVMINDMNDRYADVNMSDDDFGEVYNTMDEMMGTSEDAKENTLEGDITESESWESMTKGGFSSLRLLTGSFGLFTDIRNAIAEKIGIPEFITDGLFILFSLGIIFSIIYMIFRFKP